MADTPDTPLNTSAPAVTEAKPMHKSKTLIWLVVAALVQMAQTLATPYGYEWALPALDQVQLFCLGMAGVSRVAASGPLK